jgi:hypothetical protein
VLLRGASDGWLFGAYDGPRWVLAAYVPPEGLAEVEAEMTRGRALVSWAQRDWFRRNLT